MSCCLSVSYYLCRAKLLIGSGCVYAGRTDSIASQCLRSGWRRSSGSERRRRSGRRQLRLMLHEWRHDAMLLRGRRRHHERNSDRQR